MLPAARSEAEKVDRPVEASTVRADQAEPFHLAKRPPVVVAWNWIEPTKVSGSEYWKWVVDNFTAVSMPARLRGAPLMPSVPSVCCSRRVAPAWLVETENTV